MKKKLIKKNEILGINYEEEVEEVEDFEFDLNFRRLEEEEEEIINRLEEIQTLKSKIIVEYKNKEITSLVEKFLIFKGDINFTCDEKEIFIELYEMPKKLKSKIIKKLEVANAAEAADDIERFFITMEGCLLKIKTYQFVEYTKEIDQRVLIEFEKHNLKKIIDNF